MGQFNIACRAAVGDGQVHLAAVRKLRRVDLHSYLNVVVANLSLGQQLIVVGVIHDGDGRGIGGHGVNLVAFAVGLGGAVAGRIGGGDGGVDGLVGIRYQVATRYVDAEGLVGQYQTGEGLAVHGQGNGVAHLHVAAHATGHRDLLAGFGGVDHVVGGDVGVQGDGRCRRGDVDAVTLGVAGSGAVAGRIGGGDCGVDGLVGIRYQVATRYVDAEGLVGQYQTGEGLAVHGQGNGVAHLHVAAHATGHRDLLAGFGGVDHVVGGDVGVQGDGRCRRGDVDAVTLGVAGSGAVAGRIGGGDCGVDGLVGIRYQVATRYVDAEGLVGQYQTGEGLAVHGQGNGVAHLHVAAHATGHRDLLAGFGGVDHVVGGDVGVQGDGRCRRGDVDAVTLGVGGSGAVAGRIGGGDCGVDDLVGIRYQVATRYVDAEGLVGRYGASELFAIHGQGNGVAHLHVAAHATGHRDLLAGFGGVDHVVGGDVGVQGDGRCRRGDVDAVTLGVGGCGAVAGRIGGGDFGVDGLVGIRYQVATRYVDAEGLVGRYGASELFAIHGQGNGVAHLHVAAHATGHRDLLAGFGGVDHVVGGDVGVQGDGRCRRGDVDAVTLGVGGCGAVAGRIGGGDFGVDGLVGIRYQVATRYVDAEGLIGRYGASELFAIHGQGNGVAHLHVAAHTTGHRDLLAGFGGVDHVVGGDVGIQFDAELRRHSVDLVAFAVGGGGAVTGQIGAGHAGIDGLVVIRHQVTARHQDGEAAIGPHRAGVWLAIHCQGNGVTHLHVAAHTTGHRDLLAGFGGVDHVVGGDVGVQGDGRCRRGDVDAVTLGVGGCGAVAGRIGGGDCGVDGLVGIRYQVATRYVDAEGLIGRYGASELFAIHGQGNGVAHLHVAAHATGHRDLLAGFGGVDHVVGGDVGVQGDGRCRRGDVDAVTLGVGGSGAVAGRIGGGDCGVDDLVGIRYQVATRYVDAEGLVGRYGASELFAIDGQGDDVACLELARHGAANWDLLTRFLGVDDVIGGDVGIQFDAELRRHSVDLVAFAVGGGGAVTGQIDAGHAGIDGLVVIRHQVTARHQDGEAAIGTHRTGVWFAIDGQGDDVACLELARHGAADWDLLTRFLGVDDVIGGDVGIQFDAELRRHSVDLVAFAVGGGGAVTGQIDAGHAGIDGLVVIRHQVTARHQDGEAAIGTHRTGVWFAIDGQGDDVACLELARHGAADWDLLTRFIGVDDVIGGDVGIQFDAELRWRNVHASIVTRGAGVAGRIGHSRGDGIRAFRQRGGDIHAVAAVRLYGGGQGLLVAVGIGHDQGNGTARLGIRCTGNGRGGVVGVVRRINCDHGSCHIDAAVVGRAAGVAGRIGHCGGDGIRAFRQRVVTSTL